MKAFRAICLAAAMTLVVGSAFSQGKGGDRDTGRGGGSSNSGGSHDRGGGSSGGNSGGGSSRGGGGYSGGGSSGGGYRGGGSSGGSSSGGGYRGGSAGDIGRTRGGGNIGGHSFGGWPQRGNGDLGRGQGGGSSSGSGSSGRGGGQGSGGGQQGNGDLGRGGSNRGGGSSSGGSVGSGGSGGWGNRGGSDGGASRGGGTWDRGGSGGFGGQNDFDLGRKGSHSGTAHYEGSNNVATTTKIGGTTVIGRAPIDVKDLSRHDIIRRKDHPVLNYGGYRVGYYFYSGAWCDDYFWYPYYTFDPWGYRCCVSPWYYYPMLPPYVAWNRCHFYGLDPWNTWVGDAYSWQRPSYYGNYDYWGRGSASEIDYAVNDIVDAFERADRRAASRLMPRDSEVAIYVDGSYSYTLNADDFYDMFMDATQNVKTRRYEILRVERNRDSVRITARHEYEDPWGRITSVRHFYELRYEGRNLVISKFGVGQD